MTSVVEADYIIQSVNIALPVVQVSIEEINGHILAEPVYTDRDLPPYHRVTMDGIAVQSASLMPGKMFSVQGVQPAGAEPMTLLSPDHCIRVMTGAKLPVGTDTVIPKELLSVEENGIRVADDKIKPGINIHFRGSDCRQGDCLLQPGTRLTPAEVGILAATGKALTQVFGFPKTAVISTGDELVDLHDQPKPWQVRRSNSYMLQTAMRSLGWHSDRYHFNDDENLIKHELKRLLGIYNIVILSGGVSQGDFDFIPSVLDTCGIRKKIHHIAQRPGKPFWFGADETASKIVFALPGNPVASFVSFFRYIKPWMHRQMGVHDHFPTAQLADDFSFKPALTYFLQVKLKIENGLLKAKPVPGGGSGDFHNLIHSDGFLELPPDRNEFYRGESFPLIRFR
ncbi:MAG: molybdopterin molybdotransferase MoeA [Cyclobacteriaceae bacterium]|jgi:molybdopterin molybdotransferase|nr:molybdopterin molybdotransferase MoeA [Cyclobacteriaceae bacterium]